MELCLYSLNFDTAPFVINIKNIDIFICEIIGIWEILMHLLKQ